MIRLGVNIDHVATLRQARGETYPDPVQAAVMAELGGADNITCHLREDRRHVQDHDVDRLAATIQVPMNFELANTEEMISKALKLRPHAVTIVPEKREELTTEGGLNVVKHKAALIDNVARLNEANILVSLFIDHSIEAIETTKELGAGAIEIHTGDFCHDCSKARTTKDMLDLLKPIQAGAVRAHELGLQVHVGHGLHYANAQWLQLVPHVEEANIGHAIMARALFIGLKDAVVEMKNLINSPDKRPYCE
jgi:pyridoxine 5-phosphate synthase